MEWKGPDKPFMVSRLPKFGSRPVNVSSSVPNGIVHVRPKPEGRGISGRSSGMVWPTPFSVKRIKKNGSTTMSPGTRINKEPSAAALSGCKLASSVITESPKQAPKSSISSFSSKETCKVSPATTPAPAYASVSKLTQNKAVDSSLSGRGPESQRLQFNPSSRDSLHQSSCALKALSIDRMVRSQSFTHFKQPPPANSSIPRSFSFNKAVELAKPLPNTKLCPLRAPGLKPPQCFSSSRPGLSSGKAFTQQTCAVPPPSGCSTLPSGQKKPSSVLSKSAGLSYRFTTKLQHLPVAERSKDEDPVNILPLTVKCSLNAQKFERPADPSDLPDGAEEMSFSSASSDELPQKNDNSEELLYDFDQLDDQSRNGVPDNRCLATPIKTYLHDLATKDWAGLLGGGAVCVLSDVDSLEGSSLDLSPSSSSGGTYMWDEETLLFRPNTHTHTDTHCCSRDECDGDTVDGVNTLFEVFNLENDLMLDIPEDQALHCGLTGHGEHLERRKNLQRNDKENHLHNGDRLLVLHGFDKCPVESDDKKVLMEEFNVKQMLHECSSVKSQLLQLKLLLQMEESEINRKEWSEANGAGKQVQELVKEVLFLREELRNKDKLIHQLTNKHQHQLLELSDLNCTERQRLLSGSDVIEVKNQNVDKSTQTPQRSNHAAGVSLWSCLSPTPRTSGLQPTHAQQSRTLQAPHSGTLTKFIPHRGPQ